MSTLDGSPHRNLPAIGAVDLVGDPTEPCVVAWSEPLCAVSVPQIRARVTETARAWVVPEPVVDDLRLVSTELAGNVLRHTADSTDRIRVSLSATSLFVCLDVEDGRPFQPYARATVPDDVETGRGLLLVRTVVAEAGGRTEFLPSSSLLRGKTIRVVLPLAVRTKDGR